MQVFKLKKVGKMVDTPALLIIRRNVADELLVEIENAGDKLVLFPQAVHSFGPADGKDDRFYIQYKVCRWLGRIFSEIIISKVPLLLE